MVNAEVFPQPLPVDFGIRGTDPPEMQGAAAVTPAVTRPSSDPSFVFPAQNTSGAPGRFGGVDHFRGRPAVLAPALPQPAGGLGAVDPFRGRPAVPAPVVPQPLGEPGRVGPIGGRPAVLAPIAPQLSTAPAHRSQAQRRLRPGGNNRSERQLQPETPKSMN
jgi:hypothetical protein